MTLHSSTFHPSLIQDDAFERIVTSCEFLPGTDLEAARWELGAIKRQYDEVHLVLFGVNGQHRLKLSAIKEMAASITNETGAHIDTFARTFVTTIDEDEQYDVTPEWLKPLHEALCELQRRADSILTTGLDAVIKTGPQADLAYAEVIESLHDFYERYTGQPARCQRVRTYEKETDDDGNEIENADGNVDVKPTKYQGFVEACANGFSIQINKDFHNNTQKLTDELRKKRRKDKVTAKTC